MSSSSSNLLKNREEDQNIKMNKLYNLIFESLDDCQNDHDKSSSQSPIGDSDDRFSFFKNRDLNIIDKAHKWYILPGVREFIIVDETMHRIVMRVFQIQKSTPAASYTNKDIENVMKERKTKYVRSKNRLEKDRDFYIYAVKDIVEYYVKTALTLFLTMGKKMSMVNKDLLRSNIDYAISKRDWSLFKELSLPVPIMIISNKIVTEPTRNIITSPTSPYGPKNSNNTSSDQKYVMADLHKSQIKFIQSKLFHNNQAKKTLDLLTLDFYKSVVYPKSEKLEINGDSFQVSDLLSIYLNKTYVIKNKDIFPLFCEELKKNLIKKP